MKLNTKFYQKKEENISEAERELIEQYINVYEQSIYEPYFKKNVNYNEIYHLSSTSQNIVNWYPFQEEQTVLEIGGNLGELTEVFCKKTKEVVTVEPNMLKAKAIDKRHKNRKNLEIIVGNLENIKFDKKFDIITLIGITGKIKEIVGRNVKLSNLIKMLEPYLKENGRFLIAVDNKFGLRYFAGNPDNILNKKFESLIGYNNELEKIETFTKSRLERKLKEIGYVANFYYPLPDYKMPNVIFSDKELPKYNSVDKYNPYFTEKSDVIINEIDVFREILKTDEEMFPFFANSFFVEVSRKPIDVAYKYISFNNMRKEKYRLLTKIADNYVEKQVVDELANDHYQNIKENIDLLKQNNIKTVDYVIDEKIQSKYICQDLLLNNVLTKLLESEDFKTFDTIINQYIDTLNTNTYQEENYENTVFAKYHIETPDKDIIKDLHFAKQALWDMTFKNCFYIDNEFYFFDQEWKEENMPIEYILYRSILYTISLRRFVNIEDLLEKEHLTKYRKLFEELDNKIQEKIRDDKVWKFYSQNHYFNIDDTKQEIKNLNIRSNAMQGAIENLQKEKQFLEEQNQLLKSKLEGSFSSKVYRKLKKIIGGNNEQKN